MAAIERRIHYEMQGEPAALFRRVGDATVPKIHGEFVMSLANNPGEVMCGWCQNAYAMMGAK